VAELHRILIANRGEIAVRIIRAARDAGLASVAVYAGPDSGARHVRMADDARPLGGTTAAQAYLSIGALLAAARDSGADAVHPGYGFLAENAGFAQAVIDAGLTWIGPPPRAIRDLGDKVTARRIARRAGAPLVPGTTGAADAAAIAEFAAAHGLPVAIKAAFGGGGRGFRVARTMDEIPAAYAAARREAEAAFGRGECYAERYLDRPRHVEAQVLADSHGAVVVAGTRDCTLQRRHQKLVEEAPAPFLSEEQRAGIHRSAKAICRAAGYTGAGTVEYLLGADGTISFLEVNARLQVEHPVTEETTGIDLVRESFRIAAGEPLRLTGDPAPRGHAFEFRINAEDPGRGFLPAPGAVTGLVMPEGPGVRVDSGVQAGDVVDGGFDPLLAKVIVTGADRRQALERSRRALGELAVEGLSTVIPFHRAVLRDPAFTADGPAGFAVHTSWIETEYAAPEFAGAGPQPARAAGAGLARVPVGGRLMTVRLPGLAALGATTGGLSVREGGTAPVAGSGDAVLAPMQGTVINVAVEEGQRAEPGDVIAVVEAMKMENPVTAHKAGTVTGLRVAAGDGVAQDQVLCELTGETDAG
jgi:acetyl-CoA/propionyl-CoA/long-chain acyl-CoA carboxylase, biotin carboxylase, biotin carboxyl carrier protein